MQSITATDFFPALARAISAVEGQYNAPCCDESTVPLGRWDAFLARLQEELGPTWGPIEQRSGPFVTPSVAIPYRGPDVARRVLPIIVRYTVVAINGTPVLQLRFNALTL